jgi:hypothetical protein
MNPSLEQRLHRWRTTKNWLRVKAWFLPNVVVLSHYRSGFQWFRQICHANLHRHVVMPPQARYQHYSVERLPPHPKLDRNALLLVRDGRDVMVSLYMSSTRDAPDGLRKWEGSGELISFHDFLRTEFMRVRNFRGEVLHLRNPVEYWARFNLDWLANPNVVRVVRYEDLLVDQVREIRLVRQALGYDPDERPVDPVDVDFDKHSPVGANLLSGYQRQTSGNWQRVFSPDDVAYFEAIGGEALRALGYPPAQASGEAARST